MGSMEGMVLPMADQILPAVLKELLLQVVVNMVALESEEMDAIMVLGVEVDGTEVGVTVVVEVAVDLVTLLAVFWSTSRACRRVMV
jgi:hypothetical protein